MHKIFVFIKREYRETVLKKSFIILTILTPILMISFTVVPALLLEMESSQPTVINVYDPSNTVAASLPRMLDDTLKTGQPRYIFNIISSAKAGNNVIPAQKDLVTREVIDGFLYVPPTVMDSNVVRYYTRNAGDFDVSIGLKKTVAAIITEKRLLSSGLQPEKIKKLTHTIDLQTIKINKSGKESESDFESEYFSIFVFVMILYMTLIMYGTGIMRSIVQEKSNKVVEVILASARPVQLMTGKILGQGLVGLTQYILWATVGIAIRFAGAQITAFDTNVLHFSTATMIWFVVYYVLGYFLFSALYAIVGVASTTDQEAQQASMPITLLLIVPILVLTMLVKNPDSPLIITLSYIPFFSPIIMFARISIGDVPFWDIAASIALLITTIIVLINITAKIFRVGILMTGKRATLPEILRWLRS